MPKVEIIPERTPMAEQEAEERVHNFNEVALGYTPEQAMAEGRRCILCKNRPCVPGCPVEIDIPGFLDAVAQGDFSTALDYLKATNNLPAICGRVCPQEDQCEKVCTLARKWQPVAVGRLERFIADWGLAREKTPDRMKPDKMRVAVVGSGPASLTVAGDLVKIGYRVKVYESLHAVGGVLRYGIPEFRLPKRIIDREVGDLVSMGVEIDTSVVVGCTLSLRDLLNENDAVFVGTGAGLPYFMGIPGETLVDVYSANEFLTRVNLMGAFRFPEYDTPVRIGRKVAVIGAGNTAMDAARTAKRLGAEDVHIVYRRSEQEVPARAEEVQHAKEEGITFDLLTQPIEVLGNQDGSVRALRCLRCELGEPDESGRRRPINIPGSEFDVSADTVIVSVGQGPNPLLPRTTSGFTLGRKGNIEADPVTCATSIPGVFAGGDIAWSGGTVIEAMGAGKRAARGIQQYVMEKAKVGSLVAK